MKLAEVRRELLGQHAGLRAQAAVVGAVAARHATGEPGAQAELQGALDEFVEALRAHNACEEALIAALLPSLDAWGDARAWWLSKHHAQEHTGLLGAVIASGAGPGAAVRVQALLADVLAHMEREERDFLSSELLADDEAGSDGFGG